MRKYAYTLFMIYILAACAQLGLPQAKTFEDRLSASYATATTVVKTTTILLNAKKIGSADAENVLAQARNLQTGLKIAEQMNKTDPSGANAKLDALEAGLTALDAYLKAKQK